jgi:hypothetical protein
VPSRVKPYQVSQILSSLTAGKRGVRSLPETAFDQWKTVVYIILVHPGNASVVHASGVLFLPDPLALVQLNGNGFAF